MIKAVLLDLDNTLLHSDERQLVGEYMRLIEAFLQRLWGESGLSEVLRDAVHNLTQQRDAQTTNNDLILERLSLAVGHEPDAIRAAFTDFFTAYYPSLKRCTEQVPGAVEAVERIRARDLALVIATNPVYPAEAIRQRLEWAGLPASLDTYTLVTTADNMHFVKPDPAYYAEVVARVGVEPDEAVVVGDSLANDVLPAASVRLRTFHIGGSAHSTIADGAGTLADFVEQLTEEHWGEDLPPPAMKPEAVEPQLWGNVGALFGMLADIQPSYWMQHPDPNEWSIIQIVCHLLESEDAVQRPRLQRILNEDNPFLTNPPPPPGPQSPPCLSDGLEAARRFANRRQETIALLRSLPAAAWDRPARHSVFGLTTLLEMALFTAQHDRLHLNQLCQTLGRCK